MVSLIIISNVHRTLLIYLISSRSHSLLFAQESRLSGFIHYLACLRPYILSPQREPLKCERIPFPPNELKGKKSESPFMRRQSELRLDFFSLLFNACKLHSELELSASTKGGRRRRCCCCCVVGEKKNSTKPDPRDLSVSITIFSLILMKRKI